MSLPPAPAEWADPHSSSHCSWGRTPPRAEPCTEQADFLKQHQKHADDLNPDY